MAIHLALSLKQPWAALLVHGRKTVEVRKWKTAYRGPLLIHAARVPDPRAEAWELVPADLAEAVHLQGGVVGIGTLSGCKSYHTPETFDADRPLHLNAPGWFDPAGLFGFQFTGLRPLPFRQAPGYVRLFELELDGLDLAEPSAPAPDADPMAAVLQRFRRLARALGRQPASEE